MFFDYFISKFTSKKFTFLFLLTLIFIFFSALLTKAGTYTLNVKVRNLDHSYNATKIEVISLSKLVRRKQTKSFFTSNTGILNQNFDLKDRYKPKYLKISYSGLEEKIPKRFFVDLEKIKVGYMTSNRIGGDCSNLIQLGTDRNLINLEIKQVDSYLKCNRVSLIDNVQQVSKRNINSGDRNTFHPSQDFALGKKFDQEFLRTQAKNNPILKDQEINFYIKALTQKIVKASDYPDFPINCRVINADVLNAFAVPGGYIYIYRGLIENSSSEAELAGVIAHELAHVFSRHGTEGMTKHSTKTKTAQAFSQIAKTAASQSGNGIAMLAAEGLGLGINTGLKAWIAKSSREFEEEADYLGVQYLYRAGYDPKEFSNFFRTLQKAKNKSSSRLEDFFASHPSDKERIASILEAYANFLADDQTLIKSTKAYFLAKERLKKIPKPRYSSGKINSQSLHSFLNRIGIPAQI